MITIQKLRRFLLVLAAAGVMFLTLDAATQVHAYPCGPVCAPPKTLVLNVKNPACCGDYACVRVCVPGCCEGVPHVCSRCGILGRGIVTYNWSCGHRVTVVFTAMGTVRVW
jgi:hypothetical protein